MTTQFTPMKDALKALKAENLRLEVYQEGRVAEGLKRLRKVSEAVPVLLYRSEAAGRFRFIRPLTTREIEEFRLVRNVTAMLAAYKSHGQTTVIVVSHHDTGV